MLNYTTYNSPIGRLLLAEEGGNITHIKLDARAPEGARENNTALLQDACRRLEEYFAGTRQKFSLPLAPKGTAFQQKVWQALLAIPYGETRSYRQIAAAVGSPKASRAVGGACNRNPILIVIPCHRVIGANGAPVGYGGGLPAKEKLLKLERIV